MIFFNQYKQWNQVQQICYPCVNLFTFQWVAVSIADKCRTYIHPVLSWENVLNARSVNVNLYK
jgi:hypothetical protein